MGEFKKTLVKQYPRQGTGLTPDNIYWKNFKFPITVQEFGCADFVHFSSDGDYFAVTASARVKVYTCINNEISKGLSKFSKTAFGGRFRKDGRLLCAGSEDTNVRVFDVNNKHLLREFKGHDRPVHRCDFTADGFRVASFSDDRTVALWDVGGEARLHALEGHTDYVRAGACSPASADVVVSGGYDHAVRVWDARTATCTEKMDHGGPVEAVLVLPTGGLVVSAGGTEVRVWDLLAGGRLLTRLCHHTKTVTCLTVCSEGRRLVTGSLDRRLKIIDTASYQPVHTLEYPSPILSVGIAPDDSKIVVGMSDGLVSIQDRKPEPEGETAERRPARRAFRHKTDTVSQPVRSEEDEKASAAPIRQQLDNYDRHLRRFEFSRALDAVMERQVTRKQPERAVAVMQELLRRGALSAAVAGRPALSVRKLCTFVGKHLSQPRFSLTLLDAAEVIVEAYSDRVGRGDPDLDLALDGLRAAVEKHSEYLESLYALQGGLDMLLAAAAAGDGKKLAEIPAVESSEKMEVETVTAS
ncbi:U3 small nucleolar RNA-associated protein 15 homolog [Amphibalanus amphitrite]|uniref:U3 small nucleolar RNA-associated protein 15 homolog n=1 Tax=Amphibalanus amphitrite TaxID=1232801 RepID=UPI001C91E651|nr:U3 small nucleolar RNA-associated protein 15 homolog [Amphibalanus amphitrite]XP_043217855.1 U3 small nucleolar RNA-associated protein 15 homolog [Amphibalanus amphitrite]XP_043217856.1 U3 small nucleolar RNA-associated protein 15 homolog [Amphibalanus amphitrite]XP_043217858.1 U3 small nucleolar RNA-associated protein 15 homolog [Amphibalanus amphitrite]XP_043217859.1 U3 small nucleolar RNA-associated protein 15 homolog [Amphibalanus amphitrite]XP_043217860.1 U3 small nucleolar RNA-associa